MKKDTNQEIYANMTKGEWQAEWDDNDFYYLFSMDSTCPRPYIVATGTNSHRDGFNAQAIVNAVNATYGNGIDPNSVVLMRAALKEALSCIQHAGDTGGQLNYDIIEQIQTALEKTKLK